MNEYIYIYRPCLSLLFVCHPHAIVVGVARENAEIRENAQILEGLYSTSVELLKMWEEGGLREKLDHEEPTSELGLSRVEQRAF